MAITIPRLQRIQPSETMPQNERIKIQAPDSSSAILNKTNALAGLGEKAVDLVYDIEDSKITQLSNEAERSYKIWNNEQLIKIKNYEGDPTDAYVEYEKASKLKQQEILNARPDLNDRVKSHLSANFAKTVDDQDYQADKQRGAQVETYSNNVFESAVKLKRDNFGVVSGYVQKDANGVVDPGSFKKFDDNIADIRTTIAKRGLEKGTVTRLPDDAKSWTHMYVDGDGKEVKVQFSDMAKVRSAKELNEGIKDSINSMMAAGYTDEAKAAYDRYKNYLVDDSKTSINNKFKSAHTDKFAYTEVGKIESLPEAERSAAIDKISDPEIRSKTLAIISRNTSHREKMKEDKQDANYEKAYNILDKKKFLTMVDALNDPATKQLYDNFSSKQKEAYKHKIESPENSNPKSKLTVQDLFFGEDNKKLKELTPAKFNEYLVGLSKSDRTKYEGLYEKFKTDTSGEINAAYRSAGKDLEDQLLLTKHIKKNNNGFYDPKYNLILTGARSALNDYIDNNPNSTRKDRREFIKEHAADLVKGTVFGEKPKEVFNLPEKPKDTNAVIPSNQSKPVVGNTEAEKLRIQKLQQKYYAEHNKQWPTPEQFAEYIKTNR